MNRSLVAKSKSRRARVGSWCRVRHHSTDWCTSTTLGTSRTPTTAARRDRTSGAASMRCRARYPNSNSNNMAVLGEAGVPHPVDAPGGTAPDRAGGEGERGEHSTNLDRRVGEHVGGLGALRQVPDARTEGHEAGQVRGPRQRGMDVEEPDQIALHRVARAGHEGEEHQQGHGREAHDAEGAGGSRTGRGGTGRGEGGVGGGHESSSRGPKARIPKPV